MADRAPWLAAAESELRAVARELEVPPPRDLTAVVRQRLGEHAAPGRPRWRAPGRPRWRAPVRRLRRRAVLTALAVLAAFAVVVIATPQGRAAISRVTLPAPAPRSKTKPGACLSMRCSRSTAGRSRGPANFKYCAGSQAMRVRSLPHAGSKAESPCRARQRCGLMPARCSKSPHCQPIRLRRASAAPVHGSSAAHGTNGLRRP